MPDKKPTVKSLWLIPVAVLVLAALVGFWITRKAAPKTVEVSKEAPLASSPVLQIAGNISAGDVYLDQVKVGTLTAGSLDLPQLSPGTHTLRVSSSEGTATVPILQDAQTGPRISSLIGADHVSVTAISTNPQAANLTTSVGDVQPVLLDNRSAGSTRPGPGNQGWLALPVLQPGNHHLQIGAAGNASSFDVIVPLKPSLSLLINGGTPTGRLEVRTNVPGAELFIDGKRYSSKSDRTFHLILPARTYQVYAAHEGYSKSNTAQVEVARGSQLAVDLKLIPKNATLDLAAGSADTEIRLDGVSLTRLSADKSISRQIQPGAHQLEIARKGFVPKQIQRTFDPGQTVVLGASELSLSPVQPDLSGAEAQEWKHLKGSRSATDLQAFVQRFPGGPHAQAASQAIQQIEWDTVDKTNAASLAAYAAKHPQSEHTAEARQLADQLAKSDASRREQGAWDAVDKHSKDALNDFLNKYSNGAHADAARQFIADLAKADEQNADEAAWKSVNKSDRASIGGYLNRYPSGKHAGQAQDTLASLNQKPPSTQGDSAAILAVLQKYAAAWSSKDLSAIVSLQPSLTRRELKAKFENVRVWSMTLTPLGAPQINGDHASVACRREISQTFADGTKINLPPATATYLLRNQGASWIIDDFK